MRSGGSSAPHSTSRWRSDRTSRIANDSQAYSSTDAVGLDLLPERVLVGRQADVARQPWIDRSFPASDIAAFVCRSALDSWCSMLAVGNHTMQRAAACARSFGRRCIETSLASFPCTTLVFTFGLWFGAWQLEWMWLQSLWLAIPLIAAAADYGEDLCHLKCLRLHQQDESPSLGLTWLGSAMTWIKLAAFSTGVALTLAIVTAATLRVHNSPELFGWRGLLALAVSLTTFTIVVGLGVWSVLYRWSTKASRDNDALAPGEPRQLSLQQHTGPSSDAGSPASLVERKRGIEHEDLSAALGQQTEHQPRRSSPDDARVDANCGHGTRL